MDPIKLSKMQKEKLTGKIQRYFHDELDQDIGQFDAQFLLDFFEKEVGAYFYNQGLYDAQAILQKRMDSIVEAIEDIERPTN